MNNLEYENSIIEAYIGTPNKFDWYKKAFKEFDKSKEKISWYWNSWAMVGGFWYFLYRKQMKVALIVLFITIILGSILSLQLFVALYLAFAIAMGGFGTYLIYAQYRKQREEMEAMFKDDKLKSIGVMRIVAGVNRVALYAGIFALISLVLIVFGLWTSSTPLS